MSFFSDVGMNNEGVNVLSVATAGEFIDFAACLTYVKRHLSPVAEVHTAPVQAADPTRQRGRRW